MTTRERLHVRAKAAVLAACAVFYTPATERRLGVAEFLIVILILASLAIKAAIGAK